MSKIIVMENVLAVIGFYVQGVDLGNMIIIFGQILVNLKMGEVLVDVAVQVCQLLDNVKVIVEVVGLKVGDIVKIIVFVKDLNDFVIVNVIYEVFFIEYNVIFLVCFCVEVVCLLKDVKIEIEVIVVCC